MPTHPDGESAIRERAEALGVDFDTTRRRTRVFAAEPLKRNLIVDLCWAAAEGDLNGIRRLVVQGVRLDDADYDGRTALHLAASEGQVHVVEYFIAQGATIFPIDRWGHTPLDDARRAGHLRVVELIESHPED